MRYGRVLRRFLLLLCLMQRPLFRFNNISDIGSRLLLRQRGELLARRRRLARIVDCFSKRLQIQERLTQQIALGVEETTGARGVAVIVECT